MAKGFQSCVVKMQSGIMAEGQIDNKTIGRQLSLRDSKIGSDIIDDMIL